MYCLPPSPNDAKPWCLQAQLKKKKNVKAEIPILGKQDQRLKIRYLTKQVYAVSVTLMIHVVVWQKQ